jgi:tRNA(adenine34) deaminase
MKAAASQLGNWRLLNATLFSTLEPCPMCLAAAQAFRCKSVVYGAPDLRLGAVKTHIQLLEMAKHPYHEVEAIGGVLEEESAALLREFFRARRKQSESRTGIQEDSNNGGTRRSRITGLALRVIKQLNPFRHTRQ